MSPPLQENPATPVAWIFDTSNWGDQARIWFLEKAWKCHVEAYGVERAWPWHDFFEKSHEYPVFAVILHHGVFLGVAQWGRAPSGDPLANLGSFGVRHKGRGLATILASSVLDYSFRAGIQLVLEILSIESKRFLRIFKKAANIQAIADPAEITKRLENVRGRSMEGRLRFSSKPSGAYLRFSPRRKEWEERALFIVSPANNKTVSLEKRVKTAASIQWPPADPTAGEVFRKYIASGRSTSIAGRRGPVLKLEQWFEREHPGRLALSFSSGTMALQAAFFASGIRPGDRVAATIYSYHATVTPLLQFGVHIDFIDVEPDTGNLCPEFLKRTLTAQHKLIVTNHMWGHPVDVDAITGVLRAIAPECLWVEDCSHALFAQYKGRRVGTFGDFAVVSLQANKILPAGEGGMLLLTNPRHHDLASCFGYSLERTRRCLLTDEFRPLARTGFGLKHRIHPLGALGALLHARHHLEGVLKARREAHHILQDRLASSPLFAPMTIKPYATDMGAWYGYKPRALGKSAPVAAICAAAEQEALGISVPGSGRMDQLPLFTQSAFLANPFPNQTNLGTADFPGAALYLRNLLSFPTFHNPLPDPAFSHFLAGLHKLESAFA